ncbi:MAG TPA: chloride channel protein [Hanamia sp.]|nr:chloride channel protein [Hanamia sp.]
MVDALITPKHNQITRRIYFLTLQAIFNAIIIGFIAKGMVLMIYFFTNIAFNGRFSFRQSSPSLEHVGYFVFIIPIIGALLVGLIARYGSKQIRGHGFPETIERILAYNSLIPPKLILLKPLSAAISIGTGGPFGAEGPIIATGGAFGSLAGQMMIISNYERKIILAAGSCAGLSAIFGSPVAGILLAIELLLFEYSPRSIIPVALSCVTADIMHIILFGKEPMFAMPLIPDPTSLALAIYVIMGFILGISGAYVSKSVYAVEDFFVANLKKIHWMWWPAIGSIVVGVIGFFAPHTMGVGYDNIRKLLSGNVTLNALLALSFLKFISWSIYLGSGTSGSTLAPIFTIGGALGAILGFITLKIIPGSEINMATCALIGMAATFTGASRAILTAIVFSFETTAQPHGLLPLVGACTAAYLVSFYLMKGGTLYTEKVERLGIHTPTAFGADILQELYIKGVLKQVTNVLNAGNTIAEAREWIKKNAANAENKTFVVVDKNENLVGVVKRKNILDDQYEDKTPITSLINQNLVYVYLDEELSHAVDLMDKYQTEILPVISRGKDKKLMGVLTYKDIFAAYRGQWKKGEIYKRTIALNLGKLRIKLWGKQLPEGGNRNMKK